MVSAATRGADGLIASSSRTDRILRPVLESKMKRHDTTKQKLMREKIIESLRQL